MKKIYSAEELKSLLSNVNETIIYGAGSVAKCLMRYLSARDLEKEISCIAVKEKINNPALVEGIPVRKMNALVHYYKEAVFCIATKPEFQEEIVKDLSDRGCKNIRLMDKKLIDEITEEDNIKETEKLYEHKRMEQFFARVDEFDWKIEEQNELCSINTTAFSEYKDCYRGRDVVVTGTGPTMKNYTPLEGAIHIGVNAAWKREDLVFDYYFLIDGYEKVVEQTTEGLRNGRINCKVFLGSFLKRNPYNIIEFSEEYFLRDNTSRFFVDAIINGRDRGQNFYRDIRFHPLPDFGSVIFSALQFALFTYPKRLFIVGCDCDNKGYFNGEERKGVPLALKEMRKGYAELKEFADHFYPETEIISINPVGLKGLFHDQYTE